MAAVTSCENTLNVRTAGFKNSSYIRGTFSSICVITKSSAINYLYMSSKERANRGSGPREGPEGGSGPETSKAKVWVGTVWPIHIFFPLKVKQFKAILHWRVYFENFFAFILQKINRYS